MAEKKKKKQAKVPGFKAVSVLGKGTQGVVYKGVEEATNRTVAIKVLSPKMAEIPEFKTRFLWEAETSLTLDHPHIVKGIKAGETEGLLYFIMEFAEGKDLHDLSRSPMEEKDIVSLAIQAADALQYAHDNNLIHRDIKPGNFIVSSTGHLKILDFGLAKQTVSGAELTMAGAVMGTPHYISPEAVHDSKAVDPRSDIYSLGATLYRAATGKPPFEGLNSILILDQVCHQEPPPPRELNPALSKSLEIVILRAMAKKPHHRYASALEMKEDLERVRDGKKTSKPARAPSSRQGAASRKSSRRVAVRKGGFFARLKSWLTRRERRS